METVSKEIAEKSVKILKGGRVKKEIETDRRIHFVVHGETQEHSVIFDKVKGRYTCDCRYSTLQRKECSHIVSAKLFLNG